jgi:hypothetical protein
MLVSYDHDIKRKVMLRFFGGWLNDELMNSYGQLLQVGEG